MTAIQNAPTVEVSKQDKPDFGNGRYSALMGEVYHDSMTVFKLSQEKAAKLARQVASSYGAMMQNQPVKVSIGKANKDGKVTISEAAKIKGVTMTNEIMVLKALQFAGEAGKNGFSFANTGWKPLSWLEEYFNDL